MMSEYSREEFKSSDVQDTVLAVERFLRQNREEKKILKEAQAKGEFVETPYGRKKLFVETYVIGKVKEWRPKDRGSEHVGWGIYPIDPLRSTETIVFEAPDAVSFEDIDNVVPEKGDIVLSKRVEDWTGRRVSLQIIKS